MVSRRMSIVSVNVSMASAMVVSLSSTVKFGMVSMRSFDFFAGRSSTSGNGNGVHGGQCADDVEADAWDMWDSTSVASSWHRLMSFDGNLPAGFGISVLVSASTVESDRNKFMPFATRVAAKCFNLGEMEPLPYCPEYWI